MDNKKDIGALLKKRLDTLESKPNDALWSSLEKELLKEKRRFIPLWLRLSLLALLLSISGVATYTYVTNNSNQTNKTSTTKTEEDSIINNTKNSSLTNLKNINSKTGILSTSDSINKTQPALIKDSVLIATQFETQALKNTLSNNGSTNNNLTGKTSTSRSSTKTIKNQVKVSAERSKNTRLNKRNSKLTNALNKSRKSTRYTILKSIAPFSLTPFNLVALSNAKLSVSLIPFGNDEDTDKITSIETSRIYSIETYGGPLFLNTNGSSLDKRLNENEKATAITFSYGVAINYKLSKRSALRFGVAKTELTHITENVTTTNNNGNVIALNNILGLSLDFNTLETLNTNNSLGAENTIGLRQEISYFEIPLELSYLVIDKKIDMNVFGGLSILTLNNNEIFIESSNGYSAMIGKANNLNKVNLAFNTGVTFSTKLFNRTQLNLRPTVKYYFKTVEKTTIKFNPFSYGINLGLNYSF